MSKNNITPTPWRYIIRENPSTRTIPFGIEGNIGAGSCEPVADICGFPPMNSAVLERKEANAAHIVKCVNLHEDFIAILQDAIKPCPPQDILERMEAVLTKAKQYGE